MPRLRIFNTRKQAQGVCKGVPDVPEADESKSVISDSSVDVSSDSESEQEHAEFDSESDFDYDDPLLVTETYEAKPAGELRTILKRIEPSELQQQATTTATSAPGGPPQAVPFAFEPTCRPKPRPAGRTFYETEEVGDLKRTFKKCDPPVDDFTGEFRIMNLDILSENVGSLSLHAATCERAVHLAQHGQAPLRLICEARKCGLASVILIQCFGCLEKFFIETSPKLDMKDGTKHFEINVRGVWGEMSSGGGPATLDETMSTMGIGGISRTSFSDIEQKISSWWKKALQADMIEAGQEERELAIKRGEFDEGVPSTTVVLDGGWGKRSHKHTYNSLCGVVVVIGFYSKKLLHLEVRNKYCAICTYAETAEKVPRDHICFKNWQESSQAMEADGALAAFQECEVLHGLRYLRIIADGDSSVLATLISKGPSWCSRIEKMLCSNHVCKGLRSKLENLVQDNPSYKGQGRLTKEIRVKITSGVRCAIRMRSGDIQDRGQAVKKLRHDILNSVYHVFGIHDSCSGDFCKVKLAQESDAVHVDSKLEPEKSTDPSTNRAPEDAEEDELEQTLSEQIRYWTEGFSEKDMQKSREGFKRRDKDSLDKCMIQDILKVLNSVADKSDQLIGNYTSNLAENWMSIRMKFDGGKVVNRCQRGSWHGRCYGASLRRNLGVDWSPKAWELVTGVPASATFKKHFKTRKKHHEDCLRSQGKEDVKRRARKRKQKSVSASSSKKAKLSYGDECIEVCEDISAQQLKEEMRDFFDTNVSITASESEELEKATRQQSLSGLWHTERRKRLTASNFGKIVKMRKTTPVAKTVSSLLYSSFRGTSATRNGLSQERFSIQEYSLLKASQGVKVAVERRGLVVNTDFPFLGASIDGLVVESKAKGQRTETGIIEIKNVLHNKKMTLVDAAKKDKSFCLMLDDKESALKVKLRDSHNYFFQIQGQLAVVELPWCDFVVRCINPYQLHVERIFRDEEFWSSIMYPKLKAFYIRALLPELVAPRHGKQPGIREPGESWVPAVGEEEPKAGPSGLPRGPGPTHAQGAQSKKTPGKRKSKRSASGTKLKIVGKRINHKWKDGNTGEEKWYLGTVVDVVEGDDGDSDAEYSVKYDGDDEVYDVDCLLMDLEDGSLKLL